MARSVPLLPLERDTPLQAYCKRRAKSSAAQRSRGSAVAQTASSPLGRRKPTQRQGSPPRGQSSAYACTEGAHDSDAITIARAPRAHIPASSFALEALPKGVAFFLLAHPLLETYWKALSYLGDCQTDGSLLENI